MKKINFLIIFFVLSQLPSFAQFFKNTIIKTRPFQDFVVFNPTIGFEKPLRTQVSVELELMYRNRNWDHSDVGKDFGKLYKGTGFRLLAGSKFYFGKSNKKIFSGEQIAPFGWFATLQIAANLAITYDVVKDGDESLLYYTVDNKKQFADLFLGIGKQFFIFNALSFEFYAAPLVRFPYTEEYTIVDAENKNLIGSKDEGNYVDTSISPYLSITLGYYLK
jgi:hypothetical protein